MTNMPQTAINEQAVAATARDLAREGAAGKNGTGKIPARPDAVWSALRELGTRLWLDTGDMDEAARLWNAEFEALTTNNTLLNNEVQKGIYDDLVGRAAKALRETAPAIDRRRLLLEIAFVLNACHGLRLVERFDAFVSVELHTDLADDIARTVAYGRRFHAVCPERFYIKVPLTPSGLVGARLLGEAGIPVNLTLGFSARQNVLAALVARPAFVNVFMGRLNAFVADNGLGDGRNVGEKATLATQREIAALRASGKTASQLIGASMRDGTQVSMLAGLDVFTMPPKVASEYRAASLAAVGSRVMDNPDITLAEGVSIDTFGGGTLWEAPEALRVCAAEIGALDPSGLTAETILDRLRYAGFADLFPQWSGNDIELAAADGKIPVFAHWRDRLATGMNGLDAVINLSALMSFVADQKALDERILANIGG